MKTKQRGPLPSAKCPVCCYQMDCASGVAPRGHAPPQVPEPGDATVCMCCSAVLFYTDEMQVRKATAEELNEIFSDPEWKAMMEAVLAAVRKIRPQMEEKYGPLPHAE